jgi:hypothetical protein
MYGSPALKVGGSLLMCLAINKSAELESLAVAIDFDQRSGLLTEAPETYYVTDHYVAYPVVLVRSSQIRIDQPRDLLGSAWQGGLAGRRDARQNITRRDSKNSGAGAPGIAILSLRWSSAQPLTAPQCHQYRVARCQAVHLCLAGTRCSQRRSG